MDKKPENIEGDTKFLNRKGWYFVTYFKSTDSSRAYDLAVEKSKKIEREVSLRKHEKDGYTFWEVWEKW